MLTRLQARAAAGDASWAALKQYCDQVAGGTYYPPNGNAYPNFPNIGQGYQGEDYAPAIRAIALCYRVVRGVDSTAEARYGNAGSRLLAAMSTPVAQGGQVPSTDDGYGIRNYGVGMAVGFDWLYPALTDSVKQQVIGSLNTWIDWYDASGFIHNDPIGNYFAGYLLAKAATALATDPDNAKASAYWNDVQTRMWGQLVQPYFTRSMGGGGWPEGWGYGPLAVRNIVEFLWAAKTAKNLDWVQQLPQARDQATYLSYFAWPSLLHMDDQGTIHSGSDQLRPSVSLAVSLAGMLDAIGDPFAPTARAVAADLIAANGLPAEAWVRFLYWDDSLPRKAYSTQALSYFAHGPNHVAMRSSWAHDATWGAFVSGAYINAGYSGEQLFNEGSLTVVSGDQPLLINATGWLPQVAGDSGESFAYDDSYGSKGRRLYNTFFVNDPNNYYKPGQASIDPTRASTHIERYEEGSGYMRARGARIDQMYWGSTGSPPVGQFVRDLIFVRPNIFVLYDRTTVAAAGNDQWLAFHTAGQPVAVPAADATERRYDVHSGTATIGSIRSLLPRNAASQVVSLLSGKAYRLENHAPIAAAQQDWLTVVSAGSVVPDQVRLSSADGNVSSGAMVGVHLEGARNQVVLFNSDHAGQAVTPSVQYVVRQTADGDHLLVDMAPSASGYGVRATASGGQLTVTVTQGGPYALSAGGVLSFVVTSSGAVSPSAWGSAPPPPAPPPPPPQSVDAGTPMADAAPLPPPAPPPAPPPPAPPDAGSTSGTVTASFQQGVNGYAGALDWTLSSLYYDASNPRGSTDKTSNQVTVGSPSYINKGILRFDLSSIPPNAIVVSATLGLSIESWSAAHLDGVYLASPWDYNFAGLGWTQRTAANAWSQLGIGSGDLVASRSFGIDLGATGIQAKTVALDAAQVQTWIQNNASNQGLLLQNGSTSLVRVYSSEQATVGSRPKLTIQYHAP